MEVWPLIVKSPDGSRLAQETLAVTHAITASSPLDSEDVKGQLVRVFDAATGKVALEAPASPALDAGGNVAISPSGRRVAVLNAGAIQVFDLPAPQLNDANGGQTGR
jgi:DNA-binding beta-propeller fold protein YncE